MLRTSWFGPMRKGTAGEDARFSWDTWGARALPPSPSLWEGEPEMAARTQEPSRTIAANMRRVPVMRSNSGSSSSMVSAVSSEAVETIWRRAVSRAAAMDSRTVARVVPVPCCCQLRCAEDARRQVSCADSWVGGLGIWCDGQMGCDAEAAVVATWIAIFKKHIALDISRRTLRSEFSDGVGDRWKGAVGVVGRHRARQRPRSGPGRVGPPEGSTLRSHQPKLLVRGGEPWVRHWRKDSS